MGSKVSQEAIQAGKCRQSYQGLVSLSELCCCWAELCWPWERQEMAAEAGAGGSMPSSICQVCPVICLDPKASSRRSSLPFMSCSHWSPLGQKLTATFASCFQPSCFICSPAPGPRLALKPPEARKTGKGLQHLDLFTALLYLASGCRQYWGKAAPIEKGLGVDGMSCGKKDPRRKCWPSLCQRSLLTLHHVSIWNWIICCYKQILRWLNEAEKEHQYYPHYQPAKGIFLLMFLILSILFLS